MNKIRATLRKMLKIFNQTEFMIIKIHIVFINKISQRFQIIKSKRLFNFKTT